jgi:hypothetical protein
LNKCGKITIGELNIIKSATNGNGSVIAKGELELPLANVTMPMNINNFKKIRIRQISPSR